MMKKNILFGLLIATGVTLNSCGESESAKESTTVQLNGQVKSMTLGDSPIVVAIGEYTDNYSSKEIADLIFTGQKIVRAEVYVKNNGENDVDLPLSSFSLSDGKKTFQINGLIATKLNDFSIYDGEVGSTYTKGFVFFNVDEGVDVEKLSLEVKNIMQDDKLIGSIPLKQMASVKLVEPNTEVSLANNSMEIEDLVFKGKGTLTVNKVIDNYIADGESEKLDAPYSKLVKVEYTVKVDQGSIYCSTSNFKLKSSLLTNAVFAGTDELESGSLKAGEERSGFAVFNVPTGETSFTLEYDGEQLMKLK